jgi:hypothetical protein
MYKSTNLSLGFDMEIGFSSLIQSLRCLRRKKTEEEEEGRLGLSRKMDFYISGICIHESQLFLTSPHCVKVFDLKVNLLREWGDWKDNLKILGEMHLSGLYANFQTSFQCKQPSQIRTMEDYFGVCRIREAIRQSIYQTR